MTSHTRPLNGVRQIIRYNWHFYVFAILLIVLSVAWTMYAAPPLGIRILLLVMLSGVAWWTFASVAASFWVYDFAHVPDGAWIARVPASPPRNWALIHVGLDQTSDMLRREFPSSHGHVIDVFDASGMDEPSIRRARASQGHALKSATSDHFDRLTLGDGACDAIFLVMSAHEIRQPDAREQFFREIRRCLSPDGIIILVEHARDLANFLAFGPGFMHFMPVGEWRRLGALAGLRIIRDERRTPFVRILVFGLPSQY